MTHEQIKIRALVKKVGHILDKEINANHRNYIYDFNAAFKNATKEYGIFDLCMVIALTIDRVSEWDERYSNASKTWAKEFLYNNDIDAEDYINVRLCHSHPVILNGFAEWLSIMAKEMKIGEFPQVNNESNSI